MHEGVAQAVRAVDTLVTPRLEALGYHRVPGGFAEGDDHVIVYEASDDQSRARFSPDGSQTGDELRVTLLGGGHTVDFEGARLSPRLAELLAAEHARGRSRTAGGVAGLEELAAALERLGRSSGATS